VGIKPNKPKFSNYKHLKSSNYRPSSNPHYTKNNYVGVLAPNKEKIHDFLTPHKEEKLLHIPTLSRPLSNLLRDGAWWRHEAPSPTEMMEEA